MAHGSAKLVRALLNLAFPATGRHRRPTQRRREQARRRRALWLASVGIDTGPRRIHGVRVVAR